MASTVIPENIRREFFDIVQNGDEAAARAFLVQHFKDLPQPTQDALIGGLVEEALANEALLRDFRTEGLEAARALQKAKQDIQASGASAAPAQG